MELVHYRCQLPSPSTNSRNPRDKSGRKLGNLAALVLKLATQVVPAKHVTKIGAEQRIFNFLGG
jgi:hypothetical protein